MIDYRVGYEYYKEACEKYDLEPVNFHYFILNLSQEQLQSTLDLFHAHPAIQLTALYAPEHGIRGDVHAGEKIQSFIDDVTGLPVHSLYGETRKPTQEMLENIDIMVFDLQDLGARYYTYIYTLAYVMEACGELNIPVIVLDRPNPVGGDVVEGNRNEENTFHKLEACAY